jgi:archaellum component FlaC
MNEKIKQLLNNLPVIQNTYPEDAGLLLVDNQEIKAYIPGRQIDLKLQVGAPLESLEGSVTYKALLSRKKEIDERGPEKFGVAYVATASPIMENGEVVGVLTSIMSNQTLDTLRQSTNELSGVIEDLSSTSEEITKATDQTAQRLQSLLEESQAITNDIKTVHNILGLIKDIATQSHILGLNAAIEAARSGEHGRGFAVVANEIRKMAENSKHSTEKINEQLLQMEKKIMRMDQSIQEISSVTEEQSASMQEFHSTFEQIAVTTSHLKERSHIR